MTSVGFCRESRVEGYMSRVEGKMSRVEGKMSRVQKCRLHSGFESLVKKPEFLGRFCIIELFTFLYTIEYFHAVSSIPKIQCIQASPAARKFITLWLYARQQSQID